MSGNEQHTPLTDERLAEIRDRAENATPGPWLHWDRREEYKQSSAYGVVLHGMDNFTPWTPEDAVFIASAREDVPALLAEVERLRAALEREQNEHAICEDTNAGHFASLSDGITQIAAQNAAMRDIVRQVAKGPTLLGITTMYLCNFCDVYVGGIFGRTDHRADCPITKARALLASSEVSA